MIAINSNSPSPGTMLVQTMIIGPQTNIVNGDGGNSETFEKSTN